MFFVSFARSTVWPSGGGGGGGGVVLVDHFRLESDGNESIVGSAKA